MTGKVHPASSWGDLEEELPDDIEDGRIYIAVPHKNDLDLGRRLVRAFTREKLGGCEHDVDAFFRHRGAYAKFKDLLDDQGLLQAWHDYEAAATEAALREWAEAEEISLAPMDSGSPGT